MKSYFKSSDHFEFFGFFLKERLVNSFTKEFMAPNLHRGKTHQFLHYYPSPTAESKTSIEQSFLQYLTLPQNKRVLFFFLHRKTPFAKLRALSGLNSYYIRCFAHQAAFTVTLQSFQLLHKLLVIARRVKWCEVKEHILQSTIISHQYNLIDLNKVPRYMAAAPEKPVRLVASGVE